MTPEGVTRSALLAVAAVVVAMVVFVVSATAERRSTFVSGAARALHARAEPLLRAGASYSEYRVKVPGADPVQFQDLKNLHSRGMLSPEAVHSVLASA